MRAGLLFALNDVFPSPPLVPFGDVYRVCVCTHLMQAKLRLFVVIFPELFV